MSRIIDLICRQFDEVMFLINFSSGDCTSEPLNLLVFNYGKLSLDS